jgi:hypothetical protein
MNPSLEQARALRVILGGARTIRALREIRNAEGCDLREAIELLVDDVRNSYFFNTSPLAPSKQYEESLKNEPTQN